MTPFEASKSKNSSGVACSARQFPFELSGDHIRSMNPDSSDRKAIVADCRFPDSIVVHAEEGRINRTNLGIPDRDDGSVERADRNGRNRRTIVPQGTTPTTKQIHLDKDNGANTTVGELISGGSRHDLRDVRCRRLLFRCWHRGTQESDLILGPFAERSLANLDSAQLDRFEALLDCTDPDLFDWIFGCSAPPPEHDHDVMHLLRGFCDVRHHKPLQHGQPQI
jgi:antitoxin CptB